MRAVLEVLPSAQWYCPQLYVDGIVLNTHGSLAITLTQFKLIGIILSHMLLF